MEWLFFVTKPSSLSILSPWEAALVLAVTGGIVVLPLLTIPVILFLAAWLVKDSKWAEWLLLGASILPALILTVTALVMLDNFTYTVFQFGVVTTSGWWRGLYTAGFGIVIWWAARFVRRTASRTTNRGTSVLALTLLGASTAAILLTYVSGSGAAAARSGPGSPGSTGDRPNIIILGSDGLSSSYLSAFGYPEKTTPYLSTILPHSLVAENAFPNASSTTASTTAVLTGKEPAAVGVYRYPDVLSGQDSYEHLPGILRQYGYIAVEIGTPYYVDAGKLNLLDGFDVVNNQSLNLPALGLLRSILGNSPSSYFIWTIMERASERLLHIFFIEEMRDPLAEVNDPSARLTDEERVDQILELVDQADRPVFVFAHLMDTHGPHFGSSQENAPEESNGDTDKEWDTDLYEEAIRGFDRHLEKIYTHLSATNQLDHTILVIYTDHGYRYTVNQRIPLVIHFPHSAHAGVLENNVQMIDIPPTLLEYLDIPVPTWMAGRSLLNGEPPARREIISIVAGSPRKIAPPFYQIKTVQVIVCHKWYALNVQENKWVSGNIKGHTTECDRSTLPTDEDIHQKILAYLEEHGYVISSLE